MTTKTKITLSTILSVIIVFGAIAGLMFGIPTYNVWRQEMTGRAAMAEAEYSMQIMRIQAEMNLEAERLNAQAEIERARGAAEAMEIVQEKLTDMYIRYLWVRQVNFSNADVIYIPTEANLPLLEAGRMAP